MVFIFFTLSVLQQESTRAWMKMWFIEMALGFAEKKGLVDQGHATMRVNTQRLKCQGVAIQIAGWTNISYFGSCSLAGQKQAYSSNGKQVFQVHGSYGYFLGKVNCFETYLSKKNPVLPKEDPSPYLPPSGKEGKTRAYFCSTFYFLIFVRKTKSL